MPSAFAPLHRPRWRREGFTLAEILVVIVIILFSSTFALLAYGNYRKAASVRSGSEKVKALLTEARMRAIAANIPVAATFDMDGRQLWIDELDSSLAVQRPKVISPEPLPRDVLFEQLRINADTFTTGIRRAVFQPDGSCPLITVRLRRESDNATVDENYYSIQMYPASAEAKVWPNERK